MNPSTSNRYMSGDSNFYVCSSCKCLSSKKKKKNSAQTLSNFKWHHLQNGFYHGNRK